MIDTTFCHDVERGVTLCLQYDTSTMELKFGLAFNNAKDRYIRRVGRQISENRIIDCLPIFISPARWREIRDLLRKQFFELVSVYRYQRLDRATFQRGGHSTEVIETKFRDYFWSFNS